jgi:hypothetical protein
VDEEGDAAVKLNEFTALLACTGRMMAAVVTRNRAAFDSVVADAEAVHARIDARKGRHRT